MTVVCTRAPKDYQKQPLSIDASFKTPDEASACVIKIAERYIQGNIGEAASTDRACDAELNQCGIVAKSTTQVEDDARGR